jgi:peroxiredoxin
MPEHYILVTDPDYTFTSAWRLRWDADGETAFPSAFVVGRDGKIVFAKVSRSHGGRAEAEEVLQAIPPP